MSMLDCVFACVCLCVCLCLCLCVFVCMCLCASTIRLRAEHARTQTHSNSCEMEGVRPASPDPDMNRVPSAAVLLCNLFPRMLLLMPPGCGQAQVHHGRGPFHIFGPVVASAAVVAAVLHGGEGGGPGIGVRRTHFRFAWVWRGREYGYAPGVG